MSRYLSVIVAMSIIFTSCTKNEVNEGDGPLSNQEISFTHKSIETKGSPIGAGGKLPGVDIVAFKGATEYISMRSLVSTNAENTSWAYSPNQYWPTDGSELTFLAMSPSADIDNGISNVASTSAALTLSYQAPTNVTNQPDIMLANTKGSISTITKPAFEFNHALSTISFSVKGDIKKRISAISITNLSASADLAYGNDGSLAWSNLSAASQAYSAGIDHTVVPTEAGALVTETDGYLMMIPQIVRATSSKVSVTITDEVGANSEIILIDFPEDQAWTPGIHYNYVIQIDAEIVMIFDITASPWIEREGELGNDYDPVSKSYIDPVF